MSSNIKAVVDRIATRDEHPIEFDELVVAWNRLCDENVCAENNTSQFIGVENAAIAALSETEKNVCSGNIGNNISRMLSTFSYPTYMVTARGRIAAMNDASNSEFELNIGDTINLLPFSLHESVQLSTVVKDCLNSEANDNNNALLKRAHANGTDQVVSIAVAASHGRIPMALVFVIITPWRLNSSKLLRNEFKLTDTETEILNSFLSGYSSQDIAAQRQRSHATIRTQFQSILAKTGARNQTDLLRISLSVSTFIQDVGVIVDAVNHPHRRRAEILRAGGRIVEVTLMGDFSGKPMLTLANVANYTFNSTIEKSLYEAGIYIISVCTPGCGYTDSPPHGQSRLDCLSKDVEAILDQLEISHCSLLALNCNSALCFALANRIEERLSHAVQIAANVPVRFETSQQSCSNWKTGILKAGVMYPSIKKLLFVSSMKAWETIGAKQFIRLQLGSNPVNSGALLLPENISESQHALESATRCGISYATEDIYPIFGDWTSDVERLSINITVIHGVEDRLQKIESVRKYVQHISDKAHLIEVENAGMALMVSHTDDVIALIRLALQPNQ